MKLAVALCAALWLASPAHAQILPDGECAGVYWDLTAAFASGDRVYARVLVTRAGPGELNAAGVGYWLHPDGTQTKFQNGRGEGEFEFAATGEHVRIGSTRLELGEGGVLFEVDNDKRGVKLRLVLESTPRADATPIFAGDPAVDLLGLGRPTVARLWRTGMTAPREMGGFTTLVRTRHRACEAEISAQRIDVHRMPPRGASLLIHERLADGSQRNWLGWHSRLTPFQTRRPESVELGDWRPEREGPPLPHRLRPVGGDLRGAITIGASQLSIDPLEALPRLVRMLYWFGAQPRRVWAEATSDLSAGDSALLPRGAAIASFSFLRAPRDASASRASDSGG